MKTTRSIALLGLVLLSCLSDIAIAQQRASCSMFQVTVKSQLACPRNYEPVCGTNGVTYPNECTLCKEIFRNRAIDKKHDGRCVKIDCTGYLRSSSGHAIPCTLEYMPICGTNGITYRNKCNFCNAVANGVDVNLRNVGECFQPAVPNPNSQWDGQHGNIGTPAVPNPNSQWDGQHGNIGTQIDCGNQQSNNLICTADYNPLCGSDGRTYGNKCQFCNAVVRTQGALFLRHRGEC